MTVVGAMGLGGNVTTPATVEGGTVRATTTFELPSEVITDGGAKSINVFEATSPTGAITMFGAAAAPAGWLLCQGQAVSRVTFADLFGVVGTTYGIGDGSTTFNVPNLEGNVPVGLDSGDTDFDALGETGGEKEHVLTIDEMPSHTHDLVTNTNNFNGPDTLRGLNTPGPNITTLPTGGNQGHNNVQPYITLNFIIKN